MPSLIDVTRYSVYSAKGKRLGRVDDVLFAPQGKRVVGFVVTRPRLFFLFDLKDRYLALDRVDFVADERELVVKDPSGAWDAAAAKRLGLSWDDTVIWVGMPARTEDRHKLGSIRDGIFDKATGELTHVGLTGGLTTDAAIGVRDLPAEIVRGFDGEAVVFADEATAVDTSGGAAAAAGKGAVVATKVAVDAAAKAALYGKAAAKVAGESKAGKKAMGWLKAIKDEVADAMGDPDDE